MPIDYKKYPPGWPEIRSTILRRAGGCEKDPRVGAKCEKCGIRNYDVGYWLDGRFIVTAHCDSYRDAKFTSQNFMMGEEVDGRYVVIVLTIAHLVDPDPQNIEIENLAAYCQKCHNVLDGPMRRHNASITRRKKKHSGQLEMFI